MKKKYLFVTSLLTLALLSGVISNIATAGFTPPHGDWKWLGYTFKGEDIFHDAFVYAFAANSNAILSVTIYNDYVGDKPLNISALKVGLDWGQNYTSASTSMDKPYVIPWHETRVVQIAFTVPNITDVSIYGQYGYTIYLEHVNSTAAPNEIIGSDTLFAGNDFVVYSPDQVDAQKTMQMVTHMQSSVSPSEFNSTTAKLLWTQAENETFIADLYYVQGDFANAKTHYGDALSLINEALAAEQAKGGGLDDAQVKVLEAQAKSLEATGNYFNGLSSMWVLIGVAAVLFSIGYIIRGFAQLRKPVPTTT